MKKIFTSFSLALLFVFSPLVVSAQTVDFSSIIKQIQVLIQIIETLQEQITILQNKQAVTDSSVTPSSVEYTELPTIEYVPLNHNLSSSGVFYRFSISNTTSSLVEWKKITLQIKESDLDVSSIYIKSINSNRDLNSRSLEIDDEGNLEIYVKNNSSADVEFLSPGEKRTYDIRGLINGLSDGGDLDINIVADISVSSTTDALNVDGNFVWSKRSANPHSVSSSDWDNGYGILDGVNTLQTYSSAINKPIPVIQNVSTVTDFMDLNIYGINFNNATSTVFIDGSEVEVISSTKNRIVVSRDEINGYLGYQSVYVGTDNGNSNEIDFFVQRSEPSDVPNITDENDISEGVDLIVEGGSMSNTVIVALGPLRLFPSNVSSESLRVNYEDINLPNGTYDLYLENDEAKRSNTRSVTVTRINVPILTSASNVTAVDNLVITGSNLSSNPIIKIGGTSFDATTASDSQLTINASNVYLPNGTYNVYVNDLWSNQSNSISITITK